MIDSPTTAARPKRRWQPSLSFWIVAALVLLLVIIFAAAAGLGGVLLILGIVAVLTGLYALLFKRQSWVGLPHRKSAGLVAVSGVVAFIVGVGVAAATAAPSGVPDKSALVGALQQSATATPTATNPAKSACLTANETKKYSDELFVCTMASDQRLVWMTETDSKKAAALKAASDKAAADKAAADKVAADKVAADKAAADQAAAAAAAAAQKAPKQAQVPAAPAAPAPAAPAPAPGYVHPGAFCSGGTGISKTGKAMVCAPAKDGRLRWQGA
jgi:hypothetical protein